MFRRLFSTESSSVTGAAIIIGVATLASRIIGIVRDRVFAYYFGASPIMDAYYASFKIPDLIYNLLIVGALTAGFIPTFTKMLMKDDKRAAWKLANNIINIVGVAMAVFCALGIIFTPHLTPILFPGFEAKTRDLAIIFTRVMFLSPFILGLSMVLGGILQSLRQFVTYSLAPVFYNLGIIAGAVVLEPIMGPWGLAWGVVLGALLHLGIQIIGARLSGYRWHWEFNIKDPETRLVAKLMIPRTVGLAITQINNIIVTTLASFLAVGSVTIYNFADNIQAVPTGLIAIPFALAIFPILSSLADPKDRPAFIKNISETTRKILFLIIPTMVVMLILRAQIVRVIYGTGAFGWDATIATANTLAFFALGLVGQALIPLFVRAFFALEDSKTPFIIGIATEITTIVFSLILMRPLGVAGLSFGSAIGDLVNIILLVIYLRRAVGRLEGHKNLIFLYKTCGAAIVMALAMQALKYPLSSLFSLDYFWGVLLQGAVSGTIGFLVYSLICYWLKVTEMTDFAKSFKRKWLRFWNIQEGIDEAELL